MATCEIACGRNIGERLVQIKDLGLWHQDAADSEERVLLAALVFVKVDQVHAWSPLAQILDLAGDG